MEPDRNTAWVAVLTAMAMLGIALAVVTLRLSQAPRPAAAPGPRHHFLDSPYGGGAFLRGQPMAETRAGYGRAFAKDYSHQYLTTGYAWLAITDPNTVSPPTLFAVPGLTAVQAEEADYPFADIVAFGVPTHLAATSAQGALDWIHRAAGAAYLARPLAAPRLDPGAIQALKGLDGIQIYDARLVRDQPAQADATGLWDQLLSAGDRVWGLIADDSQDAFGRLSTVGQTSVDVQVAAPDPVLVTDALRRGAFVDSAGERILGVSTTADTITVTTVDADSITFIGSGGRVLATVMQPRATYTVRWDEGYVRALAQKGTQGRAWSQPIFVIP